MGSKLFKRLGIALTGIAMAIGVGVAIGNNSGFREARAVASYTIELTGNKSDSTQISTSTTASSISNSSSYVTGNVVTATKAYGATTSGVKLGTNSAAGVLKFNLSNSGQKKAFAVEISAKKYNDTASSIQFNGSEKSYALTASFSIYEFALDDDNTLTYVQFDATKGCFINSITVYYKTGDEILEENYISDVLDYTQLSLSNSNYANFSNKVAENGSTAKYLGCAARGGSNPNYFLQMTNGTKTISEQIYYCGIASSVSGGFIRKVSVNWATGNTNGRYLTILGSNTPFSNTSAYSGTTIGALTFSTNDTSASMSSPYLTHNFKYIAIVASGAMYINNITIAWEEVNELSSVSTSGQNTLFVSGNKFSYGGTLTAHYTVAADSTVTPASFHLGSESGTEITTDTTLTRNNNGNEIYVVYSEDNITKSAHYTITVNYKATTTVSIEADGSTTIAKNGTVGLTATVTDEYANPNVKWISSNPSIVSLSTSASASGTKITATASASNTGNSTITAYVDEDDSGTLNGSEKSDTILITVSDAAILKLYDATDSEIVSGSDRELYVSATDFTWHVVASNFGGDPTYTWSSSDTSVIDFADVDNVCVFDVLSAGTTRLSCRAVLGNNDVTVYVDITVNAVEASYITWSASDMTVYSGYDGIDEDLVVYSWLPVCHYNDSSTDEIVDGYTLKLGGENYSLETPLTMSDNGKTIKLYYQGAESPAITINVVQGLNSITGNAVSSWSHIITAKTWSQNGAQTLNGKSWTLDATFEGNDGYWNYEAARGQQFGSGSLKYSPMTLTSSAFSGTIRSVVVNTSAGKDTNAVVSVSVGGVNYKCGGSTSISLTTAATEYTFFGSSTGNIVITWSQTSTKAIYLKSISVSTLTGSSSELANQDGHFDAQATVIEFAQYVNSQMATASVCNAGVNVNPTSDAFTTAWTNISGKYNDLFVTNTNDLSAAELNYAKNMLASTVGAWGSEAAEACVERAIKTYDFCVANYGMTAFMSALRPSSARITNNIPVNIIDSNSSIALIVITISLVSLTAIGGYFFIRRRKER